MPLRLLLENRFSRHKTNIMHLGSKQQSKERNSFEKQKSWRELVRSWSADLCRKRRRQIFEHVTLVSLIQGPLFSGRNAFHFIVAASRAINKTW